MVLFFARLASSDVTCRGDPRVALSDFTCRGDPRLASSDVGCRGDPRLASSDVACRGDPRGSKLVGHRCRNILRKLANILRGKYAPPRIHPNGGLCQKVGCPVLKQGFQPWMHTRLPMHVAGRNYIFLELRADRFLKAIRSRCWLENKGYQFTNGKPLNGLISTVWSAKSNGSLSCDCTT